MQKHIFMTPQDHERLSSMLADHAVVREDLKRLEEELDRADIVDVRELPTDVVTMHSVVRLRDLDSGEFKTYRLVYPSEAGRGESSLSVLAPIGTALLGYRSGDTIEWAVPRGLRRLQVVEVLYQPEAAGSPPV
ncbi:nucleoside diphosphate kinase regulator [uncultured Paludibaculum sp.]|uniref:nucleoside diphosphate kinase regulator n=1 Tax=uncultured Paludibaculum sp. TaxID=1765020 RepID=UPI002AAA62E3|nr:nucleoside diphosphate kinase regulator [uncultured Paludibaculum sp.]